MERLRNGCFIDQVETEEITISHFEKWPVVFLIKIHRFRDFLGSPVAKAVCSYYRGQGLILVRELDATCHS